MDNIIYIVGDKLKNFCLGKSNVKTVDSFCNFLNLITTNKIHEKIIAMLGQGVSDTQVFKMDSIIKKKNLQNHITIIGLHKKERSSRIQTHKHKHKNRMISSPQRIGVNKFESYLMLDDRCAEMSDHVTGQHIQGIILIEAARQMTLAVTERFYITEGDRNDVGFITNKLTVDFRGYIFPCEVKLIYRILECKTKMRINSKFVVNIEFIQEDVTKVEVIYDFSTYQKKFLTDKEQLLANESVAFYRQKHIKKGV